MQIFVHVIFFILITMFVPMNAHAQLLAHFQTTQLDYKSEAGDCDIIVFGTPSCELYFQMGVFATSSLSGSQTYYPEGYCSFFSHEDGIWDYADQEVSFQLPDLSTSARMFFALYDRDSSDYDDLLGTYTSTKTGPDSGSVENNNAPLAGFAAEPCNGQTLDDKSVSGRFGLTYSAWFSDQSAPVPPGTPTHSDADSPPGQDYDATLDFDWSAGQDPHTGLYQNQLELSEDGITVDGATINGSAVSATVCSSGCTIDFPASNGSVYRLRLRALNGNVINIDNPTWSSWSEWSNPVTVNLKDELFADGFENPVP